MSRCPYCARELPGFETLCQQCFEAGYERVADPRPWWQRRELWHRPRLTLNILYIFLFIFGYTLLRRQLTFYHRPTVRNSAVFALAYALIVAFIESTRRTPGIGSKQKRAPENFRRL